MGTRALLMLLHFPNPPHPRPHKKKEKKRLWKGYCEDSVLVGEYRRLGEYGAGEVREAGMERARSGSSKGMGNGRNERELDTSLKKKG